MVMYENSTYRFTPAHAGTTVQASCGSVPPRVHPRSRGEYPPYIVRSFQMSGSPPLTRGIRRSWLMMVRCLRFTPAHAGNTPFLEKNNSCYEVHPRSRGEYLQNPNHLYKCLGSPPLTRGILTGVKEKYPAARFTPAHAGNTAYRP